MRRILAVVIFFSTIVSISLFSPSQSSASPADNTYTSPDKTFQFNYPNNLVPCHKNAQQPEKWDPAGACNASVPICSSGGRNQTGVLACFGFKAGPTQTGTTFQGAAFSVADLGQMKDLAACLQASKPQGSPGQWDKKQINGTEFMVTDTGGGGAGHWSGGQVYRTLHDGRCYELNTLVTGSYADATQPPTKEFNHFGVDDAITVPVTTFKFIK